jgi:preprotein translocase subunit SecY
MDRKPPSPTEENAWTINLLIVAAIIGTVVTIWLGPLIGETGLPGVILPMVIALPIGQSLDQARKRRRDQSKPLGQTPDSKSQSN